MSAPETTVFQHNFKVENDLHNVYASNGQEAVELLKVFAEDILPAIAEVNQKIRALSSLTGAPVASGPRGNPTPPATPPAGGDAPICEHSLPAKLVPAGIAKATGKPYRAFYACPQPRGQQCDFKAQV